MALNPPVLANRMPAPVTGEYMVLVRKDIEAEIVLENHTKYKGKGKLYLTTVRLVFVSEKPGSQMNSFDVPIDLLSLEKFNQPIFGANYISGRVMPLYNLIPLPATFKFWFMSGGTGTFLPMFYNIVEQIRKRRGSGSHGPDPRFVACVAAGNLNSVAYVDPNDPSVIFIEQPQVPQPSQNNVGYYFPGNNPQPPPPQPAYSSYPQLSSPGGNNVASNNYSGNPGNNYYPNPSPQYNQYSPPPGQYPPPSQFPPSNQYPPNQYPPPNQYIPPSQYPPSAPGPYPPSNQYPPSAPEPYFSGPVSQYPYVDPNAPRTK